MKASEITYKEFLQLGDNEKHLLEEVYICAVDTFTNVDVMVWTWSNVKKVQGLLNGDITYLDILQTAQIEANRLNEHSPAASVFRMFNAIKKQIEQTIENESKTFQNEIDPKARLAMDKVGGFDSFGHYPQTYELCRHFNMEYKDVQVMTYDDCFVTLAYFDRLDKYLKEYNKQ